MRIIAGLGCVMLAACGQAPERDVDAASNVLPISAPTPVASAGPALSRDDGTKPKPGVLKTFGDWTVGCDNGLACQMGSLLPEHDFGNLPAILSIARAAGNSGDITASVRSAQYDGGVGGTIRIDGKRIADIAADGQLTAAGAAALVNALANGRTFEIVGKERFGGISLKGASAALRYIDAAQGRAGTAGAIVARGSKPASARTPAIPIISAVAPGGAITQPTPAQLVQMSRTAECEMEDGPDMKPTVAALGSSKTLVILPCSAGAYNYTGALFVIADGKVTPAELEEPAGLDGTGTNARAGFHTVVNGDFTNGVLSSFLKARGLADCGIRQEFVWDGARFRLSKQAGMEECRGNVYYLTTWRAQVVRR